MASILRALKSGRTVRVSREWDLTPDTDLELAVISDSPISLDDMTSVEKAFVESGLPFRVDVVDWSKLPESLQKQIKKEHSVIQEAAESFQ